MAVEPTPRLDFFPAAKSAPANPFSLFTGGNGDAAPFGAVWDRQQPQAPKANSQPKSTNPPQQTPQPAEPKAATSPKKPVTPASPRPAPAEDAATTTHVEPVQTETLSEREDQATSAPEIPDNQVQVTESPLRSSEILLEETSATDRDPTVVSVEAPEPAVSEIQTPRIPPSLSAAIQPVSFEDTPTQEQASSRQGASAQTQLSAPPERLAQAFAQSLPVSADTPTDHEELERASHISEEPEKEETAIVAVLPVAVVPVELPIAVQPSTVPVALTPPVPIPSEGTNPDVGEPLRGDATSSVTPTFSPFHSTRFSTGLTSGTPEEEAQVAVKPTALTARWVSSGEEEVEESTTNHIAAAERPLPVLLSPPAVAPVTTPIAVSSDARTLTATPSNLIEQGKDSPFVSPEVSRTEPSTSQVSVPSQTSSADNEDLIAELLSALTEAAAESEPEMAAQETSQTENLKAEETTTSRLVAAPIREASPTNLPHVTAPSSVSVSERAPVVAQVQAHWPQPALAGQELAFELTPPELGRLRIELVQSDQGLVARFETETANARQLLHDHLPALRESLALQGTAIDRIEIRYREESASGPGGFGQPTQGDPQQSSDDPSRQRGERRSSHDEEAAQTPQSNGRSRSATGRVTQLNIQV